MYVEFSPVGEQELQHHNTKVEEFAENKSAEVDVVPTNEKNFSHQRYIPSMFTVLYCLYDFFDLNGCAKRLLSTVK